ncbi:type I restriction enzyme, S subunit [Selenomonas ruminantium]|uniref:Type I restriction enzyme, S subunit n=1 Tax=Selenomonas ruminantium TaxID=971 RepID=A0A1I3EA16_SELRU|nr:restriction endonuclease subunit S [Selenomonas ruminantium]SFH95541.1 type I restriction enzyme, S subunit [Selenomonas ruminantium]
MNDVIQLSELGEIITGNTPSTSDNANYESDDILFVKPSDISNDRISYIENTENYISNYAKGKARVVSSDTVFCTCIGIIGKVGIATKESAFNQQINAIIPDKEKVTSYYLAYALMAKRNYMQAKANAAVVPIINKTQFAELKIKYVSLEEQRRITDKFQLIDSLIAKREKQIETIEYLVKSRFVEMFGDPIVNSKGLPTEAIGDVCLLKAGVTTSAQDIHEQSDDEHNIPCYGGNGVRGYVRTATYQGDYAIIGRQGALCGNVQFAHGNFHATEHAVLVTPKIPFNLTWLYITLREMNLNRFHTGAAQPGLAVKTLNRVRIMMPDIELQNRFAELVVQADKSKLAIQKNIETLQKLKSKLMQDYFG